MAEEQKRYNSVTVKGAVLLIGLFFYTLFVPGFAQAAPKPSKEELLKQEETEAAIATACPLRRPKISNT